jgi:hypothetical protein
MCWFKKTCSTRSKFGHERTAALAREDSTNINASVINTNDFPATPLGELLENFFMNYLSKR